MVRPGERDQKWRGVLPALAITAITGLGFALRVGSIREFWNSADEGVYYLIAHAPSDAVGNLVSINAHPPLYYALLRAVAWASDDFLALRLPALLFGTLSIFVLYRVGRAIAGPVCGLVAACLLAVSPGAIVSSQVARPYAFEVLLLIGCVGFAHSYLRTRSRRALLGYSLALGTACLVHYSAFLAGLGFACLFAGHAVAHRFDRREIAALVAAHLPLGVLAVALFWLHVDPMLLDSLARAEAQGKWLGVYFTADPSGLWWNVVGWFEHFVGSGWGLPAVVLLAASLVGCVFAREWDLVGACALALVIALVASALSLYPFGGTRHSIYLLPWLALIVAAAFGRVVARGSTVAWSVLVVVVGVAIGLRWAEPGHAVPHSGSEPEQSVRVDEMSELREPLERLRDTPGLVFVDLSTAYTLMPLFGSAATRSTWVGGLPRFIWGERHVVVVPHWFMTAGETGADAPNHLNGQLRGILNGDPELAELLAFDARVISAGGRRVPRSIRALGSTRAEGRALMTEMVTTRHLSLFALDAQGYRRVLRDRLLERAPAGGRTDRVDTAVDDARAAWVGSPLD
jgi:hypothetical protein